MTETTGPDIDRSVYPMPMFINFLVSDLAAAEALYAEAGFVTLATVPGPGGVPSLVHLRREKYQDILMTQGAPACGTTSASFAAGDVDLAERWYPPCRYGIRFPDTSMSSRGFPWDTPSRQRSRIPGCAESEWFAFLAD